MFLARALSSWSQQLEMKMDWLKEENWAALAACVTLAVSGLIRLAAHGSKINKREIDDGYREPDNKQNWRYRRQN
jgi:hypothetical protein